MEKYLQNRILFCGSTGIFNTKHVKNHEGWYLEKNIYGSSDFGICRTFCFVFKNGIQYGYPLAAVFELDI